MLKKSLAGLLVVGLIAVGFNAQAEKKEEGAKAACPVSGKPIKEDNSVEYNGGKVYFCCGGCPGAFEKNTAKFAAKANHQLVVTGQAKQVACPLSGGKAKGENLVEVGGVKVCFCCANCQKKVKGAEGDAQVNLVFGDAAFQKGFKVKTE